MSRLALLIACLAAAAANTCLAADPAACMSACASEQRQCKGAQPKQERLLPVPEPHYGPAFSGAQMGRLRGANVKELDNSTASFKRLARGSACEAGYEQCARDCGRAQGAAEAGKDDSQARQAG